MKIVGNRGSEFLEGLEEQTEYKPKRTYKPKSEDKFEEVEILKDISEEELRKELKPILNKIIKVLKKYLD